MEEQYYLIPKSKFTEMVDKYGNWDSVDENQDVVNGINELTKDCPLIDLSDNGIEEESKLIAEKLYNNSFTGRKGHTAFVNNSKKLIAAGLINLKNKVK